MIKDQSGAVLPVFKSLLQIWKLISDQETRTDATGQYRFWPCPLEHTGLREPHWIQKFVATGIELKVNEQHRLDITLQVGSVEQTVEISVAVAQIETTNTQLGEVIE